MVIARDIGLMSISNHYVQLKMASSKSADLATLMKLKLRPNFNAQHYEEFSVDDIV